jgi:hypothetical protein
MLGKTLPLGLPSVALAPWQSQQDDVATVRSSPVAWQALQFGGMPLLTG